MDMVALRVARMGIFGQKPASPPPLPPSPESQLSAALTTVCGLPAGAAAQDAAQLIGVRIESTAALKSALAEPTTAMQRTVYNAVSGVFAVGDLLRCPGLVVVPHAWEDSALTAVRCMVPTTLRMCQSEPELCRQEVHSRSHM